MKNPKWIRIFLVSLLGMAQASAQSAVSDYDRMASDVRALLKQMVEADTTNPPGNEARIVKIVQQRYKEAGISFEILEFATGRQNIIARLKAVGTSTEKPVMLLAHIDVVGTANQAWTVPPHKLTEKDGYLYGRGVEDDLGMAALAVESLVYLKKSSVKLRRDVIVALTGDEESNGTGIQYLLQTKPSLIDAAFAINEGGDLSVGKDGKVSFVNLQVAEKIYQDFEVVATGTTGHSSVPLKDNAIYKLSQALDKLSKYVRPARLIPATRAYYGERAKVESPPLSTAMTKLAKSKTSLPADALKILEANPIHSANLRTTCIATMLSGGTRVNALPAGASANINCRLLPDESVGQLKSDLSKVVGSSVEVRLVGGDEGHFPASSVEGEAVLAIKKVTNQFWPNLPIVPTMSRGASDSKYLRGKGIPSYGFNPMPMTEEDSRRAHGIDERIPVASVRTGVEIMHLLLLELAQ